MSKRADQQFLSDIREALRRIAAYVQGMTYEAFVQDTKTQDAVRVGFEPTRVILST